MVYLLAPPARARPPIPYRVNAEPRGHLFGWREGLQSPGLFAACGGSGCGLCACVCTATALAFASPGSVTGGTAAAPAGVGLAATAHAVAMPGTIRGAAAAPTGLRHIGAWHASACQHRHEERVFGPRGAGPGGAARTARADARIAAQLGRYTAALLVAARAGMCGESCLYCGRLAPDALGPQPATSMPHAGPLGRRAETPELDCCVVGDERSP
jgi:hypothetical protein